MRVALEWLLDYVETSKEYSAEQIATALTSVGMEVEGIEKVGSDIVLEINVTPNRPDCLGVYGLARELAAKLGEPLKTIDYEPNTDPKYATKDILKVETDDEVCPRFVALAVDQISPKLESPSWLKKRLENSGIRPLSLIVDVTNYVMLELGQPIHAYDQKDISGSTIIARRAKEKEKLTTLDGKEQELSTKDLVIADQQKAIGLAGVMGGLNSEVKDSTSEIFIEVACFDPIMVRKTSKKYGHHTEASFRFERGIDIQNLRVVALRTAHLLQLCESASNTKDTPMRVASSLIDIYPNKLSPKVIAIRPSRLEMLIGLKYGSNEIKSALESIGIRLVDKATDRYLFEAPPWRLDIEREVDLIEEVVRMRGFEQVPTQLPKMSIEPNTEHPFLEFVEKVRNTTAALGLHETISYSFIAKQDIENLSLINEELQSYTLDIANAINEELNCLRPSLAGSLINALRYNERFNTSGLHLFEIGRSFLSSQAYYSKNADHFLGFNEKPVHLRVENDQDIRVFEKNLLSAIVSSPVKAKSWNQPKPVNADFFAIKKIVNELLYSLRLQAEYKNIQPKDLPHMHPGQSADIYIDGQNCGYLGAIHPATLKKADTKNKNDVFIFEINLERVFKAMHKQSADFANFLTPFPTSSRDVGFLAKTTLTHQQVEAEVQDFMSSKQSLLKAFELFDVYEGDKLPANEKSLAYRFHFRSDERTLKDSEVDAELNSVISRLNTSLGLKQRV